MHRADILIFLLAFIFGFIPSKSFSQSLLWKITEQGGKTSYLFGTAHVRQAAFLEVSDSVYAALATVEAVYNELASPVDQLRETGSAAYREMNMANGRYLDSVRHTETWLQFVKKFNQINLVNFDADSIDAINNYRTAYQKTLLAPDKKLMIPDDFIRLLAYQMGKPIAGLESITRQQKMHFDLSKYELLTLDFSSTEKNLEFTHRLLNYYLDQQLDSIDLLYEEIPARQRETLLDQRNIEMADSMQKIIQKQSAFFAVGAGHLPGKKGLINLLREAGYEVTPVISDKKISMKMVYELKQKSINTYKRKAPARQE